MSNDKGGKTERVPVPAESTRVWVYGPGDDLATRVPMPPQGESR